MGRSTNTGLMGLATLSLDHTLTGGGGINLTYDFVTRPEHVIDTGGKHRMSLTYNVTNNKHFSIVPVRHHVPGLAKRQFPG